MTRLCQLTAVALISLFALGAVGAGAQTSTQKSRPTPIGPTGRTEEGPRPAKPNVSVQYTLTVDSKTGELRLKAKFKNLDGNAKSFLFCQMVGFDKREQTVARDCDLFFDLELNKVVCQESTTPIDTTMSTYHFGCQSVQLGANEAKVVDYGSSGAQPTFEGKSARDFLVTYADYVELPAGATFDDTDCNDCFGLNRNTGLSGGDGALKYLGDWYLPQLPIDDPYILYQPIAAALAAQPPKPPEYRGIHEPLGVPEDFPLDVPQLPRNVSRPVPASYEVPLNLFDIYTMSAPESVSFPTEITILPSGAAGVDFDTVPEPGRPFDIAGMSEEIGTLTIGRVDGLAEGESAAVEVVFHTPDGGSGSGSALFTQRGSFLNDRKPPRITHHEMTAEGGALAIEVTALDTGSGPLAADLWFALDGSNRWESVGLEPTSDLFEDLTERTFTATVPLESSGIVQYFLTVQDAVFNVTYLGVGEAGSEGRPRWWVGVGVLLAILVLLLLLRRWG